MSNRVIRLQNSRRSPPAPDSISREECLAAWDAVSDLVPDWSAEIQEDPIGRGLCLYIIPPDAEDEAGPMLILYKMGSMFALDQFRWDRYDDLGEFAGIEYAVRAIQTVLRGTVAIRELHHTVH